MPPRYLTAADLIPQVESEWLLAVADDNRDGIADDDIVEAALMHAEAMLEAALAHRFPDIAQPSLVAPPWLRELGAVLAAEALACRAPGLPALPAAMAGRLDRARVLLADLATGQRAGAGLGCALRAEATTRRSDIARPLNDLEARF